MESANKFNVCMSPNENENNKYQDVLNIKKEKKETEKTNDKSVAVIIGALSEYFLILT